MFLLFIINNVVLIPIPSVNSRFDVFKANYSFEFVETTLCFCAGFVRWRLRGIYLEDNIAAYIVDNQSNIDLVQDINIACDCFRLVLV
jgi:hypothetical protein